MVGIDPTSHPENYKGNADAKDQRDEQRWERLQILMQ
jgi:hypothetical protein